MNIVLGIVLRIDIMNTVELAVYRERSDRVKRRKLRPEPNQNTVTGAIVNLSIE